MRSDAKTTAVGEANKSGRRLLGKRDFLKVATGAAVAGLGLRQTFPLGRQARPPERLPAPAGLPKLGIHVSYTEKNIDFAASAGFKSLELVARPVDTINAETITDEQIQKITSHVNRLGLTIAALACHVNLLDPDPQRRQRINDYFLKLIEVAAKMGVPVIGIHSGAIPGKKRAEVIEEMKRVYAPFFKACEQHRVRLALEGYPGPANVATTPAAWEEILHALASPFLGLQFDPSHLVRQFIDPIAAARRFKDRIWHVHAKDTEIRREILDRDGFYNNDGGPDSWWRYRLPGFGEVKWGEFITVLLEARFAGGINIEHEDRYFGWPNPDRSGELNALQKEGFVIARRYLSQFLPA